MFSKNLKQCKHLKFLGFLSLVLFQCAHAGYGPVDTYVFPVAASVSTPTAPTDPSAPPIPPVLNAWTIFGLRNITPVATPTGLPNEFTLFKCPSQTDETVDSPASCVLSALGNALTGVSLEQIAASNPGSIIVRIGVGCIPTRFILWPIPPGITLCGHDSYVIQPIKRDWITCICSGQGNEETLGINTVKVNTVKIGQGKSAGSAITLQPGTTVQPEENRAWHQQIIPRLTAAKFGTLPPLPTVFTPSSTVPNVLIRQTPYVRILQAFQKIYSPDGSSSPLNIYGLQSFFPAPEPGAPESNTTEVTEQEQTPPLPRFIGDGLPSGGRGDTNPHQMY